MNKTRSFTFCLLLFTYCGLAQNTFYRTFGKVQPDVVYDMQATPEGGYIMSGISNGYGGSNFLLLVKLLASGDTAWVRGYTTNNSTFGYCIACCADSGYVTCGNNGFARIDKNGNMLWNQLNTPASLNSVQQTADHGFIVVGSMGSTSIGTGKDVFLLKTDSNGIKQWSRKLVGPADEYATSVRVVSNGYMLAGSTTSWGAGSSDIYVAKVNFNGDTLWTRTYGGGLMEGDITGSLQTIEQTPDKGFIIGGYTNTYTNGGVDAYLVRIDSIGNLLWSRSYGGGGNELIFDVSVCKDGGFIFTGYTTTTSASGDVYVVRTNSMGDTLFTKALGGINGDYGRAVVQTADGGFMIGGYTNSFGSGNNDMMYIKLDSLGSAACNTYPMQTQIISDSTFVNYAPTSKIFITLNSTTNNPGYKAGGTITDACLVNGVNEIHSTSLQVYPNPGNGKFELVLPGSELCSITVTDLLGKVVFAHHSNSSKFKVDLGEVPASIYVLHVRFGTELLTKKIYVQR